MLVKTIKLQKVDGVAASVTPVGTIQTVVLSAGEGAAPLSHSGALIKKTISFILVVTAQVWVCADCSGRLLQSLEMALKRQDGQFNIHNKG